MRSFLAIQIHLDEVHDSNHLFTILQQAMEIDTSVCNTQKHVSHLAQFSRISLSTKNKTRIMRRMQLELHLLWQNSSERKKKNRKGEQTE